MKKNKKNYTIETHKREDLKVISVEHLTLNELLELKETSTIALTLLASGQLNSDCKEKDLFKKKVEANLIAINEHIQKLQLCS